LNDESDGTDSASNFKECLLKIDDVLGQGDEKNMWTWEGERKRTMEKGEAS
jgi:hypothetical protein